MSCCIVSSSETVGGTVRLFGTMCAFRWLVTYLRPVGSYKWVNFVGWLWSCPGGSGSAINAIKGSGSVVKVVWYCILFPCPCRSRSWLLLSTRLPENRQPRLPLWKWLIVFWCGRGIHLPRSGPLWTPWEILSWLQYNNICKMGFHISWGVTLPLFYRACTIRIILVVPLHTMASNIRIIHVGMRCVYRNALGSSRVRHCDR